MVRWKVVSKKIEWPEIFGKECCVPKVKRQIDAEMVKLQKRLWRFPLPMEWTAEWKEKMERFL